MCLNPKKHVKVRFFSQSLFDPPPEKYAIEKLVFLT